MDALDKRSTLKIIVICFELQLHIQKFWQKQLCFNPQDNLPISNFIYKTLLNTQQRKKVLYRK